MNAREVLGSSKRIIIKLGTSTVTYPNGRVNLKRMEKLARVLSDLRNQGRDVVIVSSGAVGVGSVRLSFAKRPAEMRKKQAAAAVGQAVLMQMYQNVFSDYNQTVAQILLTKEDISTQEKEQNIKNTFETLFELGIIPIVNANDTISTYEIEFSDNDKLSALVACITNADLSIILTDIDGLYEDNPRENSCAKRVSYVDEITEEILKMAGGKGSVFSVGGMETKLAAAKICQSGDVAMVIASGEDPGIIHNIIDGEDIGTFFAGKLRRELPL